MNTKEVKIFAAKIDCGNNQFPARNILDAIANLDLVDRWEAGIRLESVNHQSGYSICRFVNERGHGPAKGKRNHKVESFDLQVNEFFSEETSVLIGHNDKNIIIQYNHYGPRLGPIISYLAVMAHKWNVFQTSFLADPVVEVDKLNDAINMKEFSNIAMRIRLDDRHVSQQSSNYPVKADMTPGGTETVDIKFSKSRGGELSFQPDRSWIGRLFSDASVTKLEVKGINDDGYTEAINLREHILYKLHKIPVSTSSHRYDSSAVESKLEQQYNIWRNADMI